MKQKLLLTPLLTLLFFLTLAGFTVAATNQLIVGATWDMPSKVTPNVITDSPASTQSAVDQMIATVNAGGSVLIAGGTGGTVTAAMVQQVVSAAQNNGGSITIVGGKDSNETKTMMQTYLNGGTPVASTGTPKAGASTFKYPDGFTVHQLESNYGDITANGQTTANGQSLKGNQVGGYLTLNLPSAPVYAPAPPPPPPSPSIFGSVSPISGYPGQALTITATLGTTSSDAGKATDGLGTTVSIPSSGTYSYTIPASAKIGQVIGLTFYASNTWYSNIQGNTTSITVVNPMSISASANPTSLAPTEISTISASTSGFSNKVSAIVKPIVIDSTKNTVASGQYHILVIQSDNTVWASGANWNGQIGDGTFTERHTPVQVQGLTNVVSVSAGDSHSIALKSDGTVWAWGHNDEGELGNGTTTNSPIPVQVQGLTSIVSISAGNYHNLALRKDGIVFAWGYGPDGQLGNGNTVNSLTPVQVSNLSGVIAIGAGGYHSLAVTYDGKAWAWGYNGYGQLGDSTISNSSIAVQVIGITNAKTVSGGMFHSALQKTDNTLWAWGYNAYGQLGNGTTAGSNVPVRMGGGTGYSISAGGYHTTTIGTDNQVWSVGYNGDGQLGNGNFTNSTTWYGTGLTNALKIGSGPLSRNSLAIRADNTVWAWGVNANGQLAEWTTNNNPSPLQYQFKKSVISIASSGMNGGSKLAIRSDGTVWSWGNNSYGQLGDGTSSYRNAPVQMQGINNAIAIASGPNHSLVLKSDRTVWACGYNGYGQLGNGTNTDSLTLVQVQGLTNVKSIAAGGDFSVALKYDGTVWVWGINGSSLFFPLGLGSYLPSVNTPRQAVGLNNILSISAGHGHIVAAKSDGTVWACGYNGHGQIGNGTSGTNTNDQFMQTSISGVSMVAAGGYNSYALKSDGTVWAWGWDYYGQDGYMPNNYPNYLPIDCSIPGQISVSNVTSISGGDFHLIMRKNDGTVWSMGRNDYFQAGDGGTPTPTSILPNSYYSSADQMQISSVIQVAGGYYSSNVLKSDGSVLSTNDSGSKFPIAVVSTNLNTATPFIGSVPASSSFSVSTFSLSPSDYSYPKNNTWSGPFTVPTNTPVGGQLIITLTGQSPWSNINGQPQLVSTTLVLQVQNNIKLSAQSASKMTVNPGDTITVTVASTNYALGVTASGPNPSNPSNPITFNMNPNTPIGTIPKNNTWWVSFTIPSNAPVGAYPITLTGTNTTFTNQPPSKPLYLNLTVGSPPVQIVGNPTAVPDPAYSHRPGYNVITLSAQTQGFVSTVNCGVSGETSSNNQVSDFANPLPNMSSSDSVNWTQTYTVPDNVPDGTTLTFSFSAVASNGAYTYGPVYTSVLVKRYLYATGHISSLTAVPGQIILLDGSTTDGYASSLTVTDDQKNSVSLATTDNHTWTGPYTVPMSAQIGQTVTLTWVPKDFVSGTTFTGGTDQKTITITNTPQIVSTIFNQTSPYPGADTGAPTGTVDALITTTGYVTTLSMSWDTSYSISSTNYVDLDSSGTRQFTVKGLTVPANADVSNVTPTILHIKGQTAWIDQATGSVQTVLGTANLRIANKIVATAQQLANPIVDVSAADAIVTLTIKTTGYATQAWAKKLDGTPIQIGSTVTGTIPYSNTFTGSYTIPRGTATQIYHIPVYATNTTFVNQPQSVYDYITVNIGGVASVLSAYLSPYQINLPAATIADRTVTMYAQTTGPASDVQVSVSVNGGPATVLPSGSLTITSGTTPGVVNWQGDYLVDPGTADGTLLTFSFQAKDASGNLSGQIITPPPVTVHQKGSPLVIITH